MSAAHIVEAARALLVIAPELSRSQVQLVLAQAHAETDFGYSFRTPDGSCSNNWGGIYAPGTNGTIPVGDTNDGKPFTANAAWNRTPEDGARQLVRLVSGPYSPAMDRAAEGDAWGYARALWRDGPSNWWPQDGRRRRPAYFGGFPPGHRWSLAPAGTVLHSDADAHFRVLAYARMLTAHAQQVARALGEPLRIELAAPSVEQWTTGR